MHCRYYILMLCIILVPLFATHTWADEPQLIINSARMGKGIVTISYTVVDATDVEFITSGWQFSTDGGITWLDIDTSAISNNNYKSAGSSSITWDTQKGENTLTGEQYFNTQFRMYVNGGNTWKTRSPMPIPRAGHAAVAAHGKIYVIGGYGKIVSEAYSNDRVLSGVMEYDPNTDTWHIAADMRQARHGLATTVLGGKIYAIGGDVSYSYKFRTAVRTVEEYDPGIDTWRNVADMGEDRHDLAATVLSGKIYAIGGANGTYGGNILKTVEAYDPIRNSWYSVSDMQDARRYHGAVVLNGKIYVVGSSGPDFISAEEYDPDTDSWSYIVNMPSFSSAFISVVAVDNKIYTLDRSYRMYVKEYDPAINSWYIVSNIPTKRNLYATAVINGKIYVTGGDYSPSIFSESNEISDIVEEYTPPRESTAVGIELSVKGDLNYDHQIRSDDAILALRISEDLLIPTERQNWAADVNGDGIVNSSDAMFILCIATGQQHLK